MRARTCTARNRSPIDFAKDSRSSGKSLGGKPSFKWDPGNGPMPAFAGPTGPQRRPFGLPLERDEHHGVRWDPSGQLRSIDLYLQFTDQILFALEERIAVRIGV